MDSQNLPLSRRSLLKGALVGAGISSLGWTSLFGITRAFAQDASGTNDDVQTVLNLAATAELFASTHYLGAINAAADGDLDLDEAQVNYLRAAFLAERSHYDLLLSLGAVPVATRFHIPEMLYRDKALFNSITLTAETTFVSAYLAATRIFSELGETAFAVTAAQIAGVEAQHLALARQIAGLLPNDRSYQEFQFANVSDAVPVLQPFLDGTGEGFIGPITAPSDDEVAEVRAQAEALGYTSGILPYAATVAGTTATPEAESTAEATAEGTAEATPEGTEAAAEESGLLVTAGTADVNVRRLPDITSGQIRILRGGTTARIDGLNRDDSGMLWWHLTDGGWVRSDTVEVEGDPMLLPLVND